MALPSLTGWELERKLIFVVKKEDDNLDRLLEAFQKDYPQLRSTKLLLIDDEADVATVTYRKKDGNVEAGVVQRQIDELRNLVKELDFLMVTATPYALYLQPEEEVLVDGDPLFLPKRPAFTEILPIHAAYVGGDYYFEKSSDAASPAHYFYRDVPVPERDALKKPDARRLKLDLVLTEKNTAVLCSALTTFIVGGVIRRLQQEGDHQRPLKYSFLFHTEHQRQSHDWQEQVVTAVQNALMLAAEKNGQQFDDLVREAFNDLERSLKLESHSIPGFAEVKGAVRDALLKKHLMITTVNSDQELNSLLDDEDGQLKLRTPLNVFIGGQILDRGITIANLIGFYYGRNPKKFQQDTVLQHSRMYGARSQQDLAVTRFYAPLHIYQTMRKIHEFDAALREAFEKGAHDQGVYFIQKDAANRLVPCSPNKLLFSRLTAIRPGGRLLPVGFQTVSKTTGTKGLGKLDEAIHVIQKGKPDEPTLIDVQTALDLLALAFANLEFGDDAEDERKGHSAALGHLSRQSKNDELRGKVWLVTARERDVARVRESGRFSDAPDSKQYALAAQKAQEIPALILLRQNGNEDSGWRGLSFWWPVIVVPEKSVTSIFAAETPDDGD